jgi:GGDEF domain-containing protein
MGVNNGSDEAFNFTARAYRAFKWVLGALGAVVAFLLSAAALKVTIDPLWLNVRIPLWLVATMLLGTSVISLAFGIAGYLVTRDALRTSSAFRSKAASLSIALRDLESLAYIDPITGIENTSGLERKISLTANDSNRVLILLDLKQFGKVNKTYNHWKGDEYLRRFASALSLESRRSEYVYKRRDHDETIGATSSEARAFRKGSASDEFFVLLTGDVADALGYLNRLIRRRPEFEKMALDVLGGAHPFGFNAGIVLLAPGEEAASGIKRVSECLQLAADPDSQLDVYWAPGTFTRTDAIGEATLSITKRLFKKP